MADVPERKDNPREDPSDTTVTAYEMTDTTRSAAVNPTEQQIERELPTLPALDYSPAPPAHDPYAALRHADFRRYLLGAFIMLMGTQVQSAAVAWEIYRRVGEEIDPTWAKLALGLVAALQWVPLVVLAIPSGQLADTRDRRHVISISMAGVATCSIGLALLSYRPGSIPWMLALLAVDSTFLVIGRPARASIMPWLVPKQVFSNAVTWNSSLTQISSMVGPMLGGYLLTVSRDWLQSASMAYAAASACALTFGGIVLTLNLRRPESAQQSVDRSLLAGFRFIWRTRPLMGTILLDLFAVLLGGVKYLIPVVAVEILHVREFGYTMLLSGEAVGAFCMTLVIAHMPPMQRAGRNMLLAVAGFGLAAMVLGLSRHLWLSWAMLVCMGAMDSISVIVRHTLVQVLTPDAMRGRVSAVNNISIGASNELGGVRAALVAAAVGTVPAIMLGGVGSIATVIVIAAVFPQILRIGSLQDVKPEDWTK